MGFECLKQCLFEWFRWAWEVFTFGGGWEGHLFSSKMVKLRIEVSWLVFFGLVGGRGRAVLAVDLPLSFGCHLIEYKLLITCQRYKQIIYVSNRFATPTIPTSIKIVPPVYLWLYTYFPASFIALWNHNHVGLVRRRSDHYYMHVSHGKNVWVVTLREGIFNNADFHLLDFLNI